MDLQRKNGVAGPMLCIILTLLSGLSVCYRLDVWVRYAVDAAFVIWALCAYLAAPRREAMRFCLLCAAVYRVPFAFAWLWSLAVWIARLEEAAYIVRGSLNTFYMAANALYAGALFYLFGRRSAAYVLCGMALANGFVLAQAVLRDGLSAVAGGYIRLLATFASETGETMERLEMHDMVFAWGAVLLYGLLRVRRLRKREYLWMGVALFFFTLSLKRIACAGLAVGLAVGAAWSRLGRKGQRRFLHLLAAGSVCAGVACVMLIHSGAYERAAAWVHMNTMGRTNIYAEYREAYELSPLYMGRGVRFVYEYGRLHGTYSSMHSVYLEQFVALGFWGMGAWLALTWMPAGLFSRRCGGQAAAFLAAGNAYLLVSFATDNTLYHYPVNTVLWLLAMNECGAWGGKHGGADGAHAHV